jgi:glycosyltransferase involved in cell wall biosynthesis
VTVFCQRSPGTPGREERDGVRIVRLSPSPGGVASSLLFGLNLTRALSAGQGDADLCYCNLASSPAIFARKWAVERGIPMVLKFGASGFLGDAAASSRSRVGRWKLGILAKDVDLYLCPNGEIRREFLELGYDPEKLEVFPNGVDTETFRPAAAAEKSAIRRSLGWNGEVVALFAGRLEPQKNIPLLLRGWKRAAGEKALLVLAGTGSREEDLRLMAEEGGGEGKVLFAGAVEPGAMLRLLQAADLFVLPSLCEGMSNAVLEAMACGLPVLASDIPGNSDLVRHGGNGLLFDTAGDGAFTAALEEMLSSRSKRELFGAAGRERVRASFSIEMVGERYLELVGRLIGR